MDHKWTTNSPFLEYYRPCWRIDSWYSWHCQHSRKIYRSCLLWKNFTTQIHRNRKKLKNFRHSVTFYGFYDLSVTFYLLRFFVRNQKCFLGINLSSYDHFLWIPKRPNFNSNLLGRSRWISWYYETLWEGKFCKMIKLRGLRVVGKIVKLESFMLERTFQLNDIHV